METLSTDPAAASRAQVEIRSGLIFSPFVGFIMLPRPEKSAGFTGQWRSKSFGVENVTLTESVCAATVTAENKKEMIRGGEIGIF